MTPQEHASWNYGHGHGLTAQVDPLRADRAYRAGWEAGDSERRSAIDVFRCERCGWAAHARWIPATMHDPGDWEKDPPDECPECSGAI